MRRTVLRVALGALAALMVPLIASRVVEGWRWGPGAFVFTYALFFATGMAYALIAGRVPVWSYRAAVALALSIGFVVGWATMVHLSETENPVLLVYYGVLAVGVAGAALARLRPRGLERTAYLMAAATGAAWAITQVLFPVQYADPPDNLGLRHAVLALLFLITGLLFRHAGRRVEPDAGPGPEGVQENTTSR
jgi:hypothetical protein